MKNKILKACTKKFALLMNILQRFKKIIISFFPTHRFGVQKRTDNFIFKLPNRIFFPQYWSAVKRNIINYLTKK